MNILTDFEQTDIHSYIQTERLELRWRDRKKPASDIQTSIKKNGQRQTCRPLYRQISIEIQTDKHRSHISGSQKDKQKKETDKQKWA